MKGKNIQDRRIQIPGASQDFLDTEWKPMNYTGSVDNIHYYDCSYRRTRKLKGIIQKNSETASQLAQVLLEYDSNDQNNQTTLAMLDSVFRFSFNNENPDSAENKKFVGDIFRSISQGVAMTPGTTLSDPKKADTRIVCLNKNPWSAQIFAQAIPKLGMITIFQWFWDGHFDLGSNPCQLHFWPGAGLQIFATRSVTLLHEYAHLAGAHDAAEIYAIYNMLKMSSWEALKNAQQFALAAMIQRYGCHKNAFNQFGRKMPAPGLDPPPSAHGDELKLRKLLGIPDDVPSIPEDQLQAMSDNETAETTMWRDQLGDGDDNSTVVLEEPPAPAPGPTTT
ncbi:MAG: hypothetical protein M1831_006219 [Alyxoria varia]|nr:MAG: hypothetical protein M1831_006219 [Alyxoria varia]